MKSSFLPAIAMPSPQCKKNSWISQTDEIMPSPENTGNLKSRMLLASVLLVFLAACGDKNTKKNTPPKLTPIFTLSEGEDAILDWQLVRASNGWLHAFATRSYRSYCVDPFTGIDVDTRNVVLSHHVSADNGATWQEQTNYDYLADREWNHRAVIDFKVTAGTDGSIVGVAWPGHIDEYCSIQRDLPIVWTWMPDGQIVFQPAREQFNADNAESIQSIGLGRGAVAVSTTAAVYLLRTSNSPPEQSEGYQVRVTAAQASSPLQGRLAASADGVLHVVMVDEAKTFDLGDPVPVWRFDSPRMANDTLTHNLYHATIDDGHWTMPAQLRGRWLREHDINSQGEGISGTRINVVDLAVDEMQRHHLLLTVFSRPQPGAPLTHRYLTYAVASPDGTFLEEPTFLPGNDGGFLHDAEGHLAIMTQAPGKDAFLRLRVLPIGPDGVDRVLGTPRDREGDGVAETNRADQVIWLGHNQLGTALANNNGLFFTLLPLTDVQSNRMGTLTPQHLQVPAGASVPLAFDGFPENSRVRWDLEPDGWMELEGAHTSAELEPGFHRIAAWAFGADGEIWVQETTVEVLDSTGGGYVERGPRIQAPISHEFFAAEDSYIYAARDPAELVVFEQQQDQLVELGSYDLNMNASPGYFEPPHIRGIDLVRNSVVFLRVDLDGMVAVDVSDPVHPREIGRTRLSGGGLYYALGSPAYGTEFAWAADGANLFQIELGSMETAGPISIIDHLQTSPGQFAYLDNGFLIFANLEKFIVMKGDGSFPPPVVGQLSLTSLVYNAPEIIPAGHHAYLFSGGEMHEVDVSNPTAPRLVRSFVIPNPYGGDLANAKIHGSHLFIFRNPPFFFEGPFVRFNPAMHVFDLSTDPPAEAARYWEFLPAHIGQLRILSDTRLLLTVTHEATPPLASPETVRSLPILVRPLDLHLTVP